MSRLDAQQRRHAVKMLDSGWWPLLILAEEFGLTVTELQIELGLPQWKPECLLPPKEASDELR